MATTRESFLQRVRAAVPAATELPPVYTGPSGTGSFDRFVASIEAVGGTVQQVKARSALLDAIGAIDPHARRLVHPSLRPSGPDQPPNESPEVVVLPGVVGVAEDGSVLVDALDTLTPPHHRSRALPFLAEHMVIVLHAGDIVADLHAALTHPAAAAALSEAGFAVWVSGPSKTADIEQTLVLGAHGPERLTILLVGAD